MPILCKVEQSEVNGKLRGLKITHPDMGLIMNWGCRLSTANVRYVSQEVAFQMMADIERVKTLRMKRQQAEVEVVSDCPGAITESDGQYHTAAG